jgi:hypothetical protein
VCGSVIIADESFVLFVCVLGPVVGGVVGGVAGIALLIGITIIVLRKRRQSTEKQVESGLPMAEVATRSPEEVHHQHHQSTGKPKKTRRHKRHNDSESESEEEESDTVSDSDRYGT